MTVPAGRANKQAQQRLILRTKYRSKDLPILHLQADQPIESCAVNEHGEPWASESPPQLYIVRFNEYKMAAEHERDVSRRLAREAVRWSWVERNNRAMAYPTDFGLLQLAASTLEASMASNCLQGSVCDCLTMKHDHPRSYTCMASWQGLL